MRTEVIRADTIDQAVERILNELKGDTAGTSKSRRNNVIYFDGWDGLGASTVLRAIDGCLNPAASQGKESALAGRRALAAGLEFSQIFHIDCSKWESRRAMQRMIVKQLVMLPPSVLEMLDAQDEEDNYKGVDKGLRAEIPQVAEEINQHILKQNLRFLLIIHNGSTEEIDLDSLGFPLLGRYSRSKVLWTFQGRFRFYPRMKVDRALKNTRTTDVVISAQQYITTTNSSYLVEMEARDVAREITISGTDLCAVAANCFLYVMKLCRMGSDLIDYELATHACNYWICDGIINLQQGDVDTTDCADGLWLCSEALRHVLRLDPDYYKTVSCLPSPAIRLLPESTPYWTSPTFGIVLVPDPYGQVPKGMFQQFDKLSILKLWSCQLSIGSPPFLSCRNLRFLWLDSCQHRSNNSGEVVKMEDIHQFFRRLWVLDVRYSSKEFLSLTMMNFITQLREFNVTGVDSWDIMLLEGRLHNIRKLRARSLNRDSYYYNDNLFLGKDKMELLDFSGNNSLRRLSVESSCRSLETVIIDGSTFLKEISLIGCSKLKNLFLSGSFPELYSIYITDAAVQTLDLSLVMVPKFDRLSLLECGKLCAILWPQETEVTRKSYLGMLQIDTTQKKVITTVAGVGNDTGEVIATAAGRSSGEFSWNISVTDARILGSLEPIKKYFGSNRAHVEISTTINPYAHDPGYNYDGIVLRSTKQQVLVNLIQLEDNAVYIDLPVNINNEKGDFDALAIMCVCPPPPDVSSQGCYIHIEDQMRVQLQGHTSMAMQGFICDGAKTLHIHDSLNITSIIAEPLASETWNQLEWCRVERCPKMGYVFSPQLNQEMFSRLRTVWVSHLSYARCIWKWSDDVPFMEIGKESATFADLTILHLDYCPKLRHIIHFPMSRGALGRLETLEIMWCGDLSLAFDIFSEYVLDIILTRQWTFHKMKHIRLHELPRLQSICAIGGWVWAPELETINIRGCWSLRRLPIVRSKNVVVCNCEKEWWDNLEWKSAAHAGRYKPTHPRYYKKTMLRGSILR